MVAAKQGERQALLTAIAVRCAASRGLRRRRREEAPKKAMEKMSGRTQGRAESAETECVTEWWVKTEGERLRERVQEE